MSERESMPCDVVIIGGGVAGLAAAIRLKQINEDLEVVVLEKGSEIGAHILSGAVVDPKALDELLPEWRDMDCPMAQTPVGEDLFYTISETGASAMPHIMFPPFMSNVGCYTGSLGNLCRGEAGEDHYAKTLGLFTQPASEIAERAGVIAVIAHEGGQQEFGQVRLAGCRQHPVVVLGHGGFCHRAIHVAPLGEQFIERTRSDHRPRKDMRADFAAFFEHDDLEVLVDLLQPDRGCQACHATADDDDIAGHRFAFAHVSLFSSRNLCVCLDWWRY